jgi:hypothetical protein
MTLSEIHDPFLSGYLECALWSSSTDDAEYFDELGADLSPQTLAEAKAECAKFEADFEAELERYYDLSGRDEASAGHDLWLTRNGHGAGFWDRVSGEDFKALCDGAKALGEIHPCIGDDGLIYFE